MDPALITAAEAAEILGVSVRTVHNLSAKGELDSDGRSGPGVGTLASDQVEDLARRREAAAERSAPRKSRGRPLPPDERHEWLTTSQVASMLGVTRQAVVGRCTRETLPYAWNDGQRWLRADLLRDLDVCA